MIVTSTTPAPQPLLDPAPSEGELTSSVGSCSEGALSGEEDDEDDNDDGALFPTGWDGLPADEHQRSLGRLLLLADDYLAADPTLSQAPASFWDDLARTVSRGVVPAGKAAAAAAAPAQTLAGPGELPSAKAPDGATPTGASKNFPDWVTSALATMAPGVLDIGAHLTTAQPGSLTVVQGVPEALVVPLGHTLFLPAADLAHSTIQALWTAQSVAGCQQIFTGQRDFFNQPGCPLAFPNIYLGLKTFTPGISKAKVVAAIGHAGPLHEALASEAANLKPLRRIILSHFDAGLPSEDGLAELVDLVRALKSSGAPMVLLCTDPLGAGPADALRGLFPSLALVDFGTWSPAVSMPAIKLPPTAPPTDMPAPAAAPAEAKMSALPRVGFLLSVDAGPPSSGLIRDIFSAMVFRSTLFLGRDVLALREILAGLAEERIPAAGLNAARAARLPEVLRALRRSIIRALVVHHWPGLALSKADSQDIGLVVVVLAPGDLPAAGTGGLAAAVQALLPGSLDARTRLLVLVPSSQLAEAKQTLPPHWLAFTSGKELHFRM